LAVEIHDDVAERVMIESNLENLDFELKDFHQHGSRID